ncbi:MAG: MarR family transcriptional regulator [Flavobacteriales bacterium]|nr:MarR family transcriptional regulator [Flavobacteriales bacterium]MBK9514721.1 MarR family transcriptional regulator [Flavobacteriales bacterium]MBP7449518.1 MarR family transcriptional regulator [Flavobacteriales bacterium]
MSEPKSPYCNCLYHAANAMARSISRLAEEEFAKADLVPTQAFILMSVINNPGITAGDIARQVELSPSNITRMLDKLEARDLVSRSTEGKLSRVYPTPASLQVEPLIKAAWGRMYARYSQMLGKENGAALAQDLTKASSMLDQQI